MLRKFVQSGALISGKFVPSISNKSFPIFNPANGEEICKVADCDVEDARAAINVAYDEFHQTFKRTSGFKRSQLLRELANLILQNEQSLAELIVAENGKCLSDARVEVSNSLEYMRWFSEEARRINGFTFASAQANTQQVAIKQPLGVVGIIVPFNFPLFMLCRNLGAVLAAGCTAVVKPSPETPLSSLALGKLMLDAGFSSGCLQVLPCLDGRSVGQELCSSTKIQKMAFTGSSHVGKLLYAQSASTVKRLSLELGGNAPFIVFPSANLDEAVNGVIRSKFRCAGQTCVSANRIFVHSSLYDAFVERLVQQVRAQLKTGPGMDEGVNQGPLINQAALDKVDRLVQLSITAGARLLTGGSSPGGLFYSPTVLADVTPNMPCAAEEVFGPVASVLRFETEDEVVRLCNELPTGLAAYFYSQDVGQIHRVARDLESGMVGVNECLLSCPEAPFGGVKESGFGKEGSHLGIDEYLNIKYIRQAGLPD